MGFKFSLVVLKYYPCRNRKMTDSDTRKMTGPILLPPFHSNEVVSFRRGD